MLRWRFSRALQALACGIVVLAVMLASALHFFNNRPEFPGGSIDSSSTVTAFSLTYAYEQLIEGLNRKALDDAEMTASEIQTRYQLFDSAVQNLAFGQAGRAIKGEHLRPDVIQLRTFTENAGGLLRTTTGYNVAAIVLEAESLRRAVLTIARGVERTNDMARRQLQAELNRNENQVWLLAAFFILLAGALLYNAGLRNRKLRAKTDALILSQERLRKMSYFRQQFLANMSHEFRTPLNAIQGFSQVILHRKTDISREQMVSYVRLIEKSSRDLVALTENVLDLSKIEAGKFDLAIRETEIRPLVVDAIEQCRPLAAERKIALRHYVSENWEIRCDRDGIIRCITNLISNSIKYSDAEAPIDVFVYHRDTRQLIIEVRDRGCGIPVEELESIWTAYTRSSLTRKSDREGAGLGLAIIKSMVDAHNGTVELDSKEGEGTTVRLCFPSSIICSAVSTSEPILQETAANASLASG